jgi:tetratricopeptide (TPR) repeat protein
LKFFLFLAVIAGLSAATPAVADYKSEYKAYLAAIEAGDVVAALERSEASWRAAEIELGDDSRTAILAYNFARLAQDNNYKLEAALEAFKRAAEITGQGKGELPAAELDLTIGDLAMRLDWDNRNRAKELEAALEKAGPAIDPLVVARAWRTLAQAKLRWSALLDAKKAADQAVKISTGMTPKPARLLREALILGAISRLAHDRRDERDIAEAVALFGDAFPLFPPQQDIDHFDTLLAVAMSWRHSIEALVRSSSPFFTVDSRLPTGEELNRAYKRALAKEGPEEWSTWVTPAPPTCETDIVWAERKPPKYPPRALRKAHVGSILVGYDLNDAGVERSVLLADFPEAGFGEAAIQSMKDWRLKSPAPDACRKNRLTFFVYVVRNN